MPCRPFPAGGWWVPHHPAYDDDGEHGGGSGGNVGGKDGGKDDQLQGQWERHNTTNNFCPNQGSSCSPGTSPTQVNTMQCKGCGCGEALKLQWGEKKLMCQFCLLGSPLGSDVGLDCRIEYQIICMI